MQKNIVELEKNECKLIVCFLIHLLRIKHILRGESDIFEDRGKK